MFPNDEQNGFAGSENQESSKSFEKIIPTGEKISPDQIQVFAKSLNSIVEDEARFLLNMYSSQNYNNTVNNCSRPDINIIMQCENPNVMPNYMPNSYFYPVPGGNAINPPNQYFYNPVQAPMPYNMNAPPPFMPDSMPNPYNMFNLPPQPQSLQQSTEKIEKKKKDKKKKDKKDKKKKKDSKKEKYDVFDCPSGIFSFLFSKYSQNPVSKGLVTIEGDSDSPINTSRLPSLIDTNFTSDWMSKRKENPKIKISFINSFVKINKYKIAIGFKGRGGLFKSWILSGINEKGQNVVLDDVNNSSQVSESNRGATNDVSEHSYLSSIQLEMKSSGGQPMLVRNIEIFGSIKIKKEQ